MTQQANVVTSVGRRVAAIQVVPDPELTMDYLVASSGTLILPRLMRQNDQKGEGK